MLYIKLAKNENGGHLNQKTESNLQIPDGWAVFPTDEEPKNFPYGEVEAVEIDGIMTVTKWTPLPIPSFPPEETAPTELERLRADVDFLAALGGVEL